MSVVVETLLIQIEAQNAVVTLGQVDQGLTKVGASAVSTESKLGTLSQGASGLGSTLAGLDRALTSQIQQFALYAAGALSIHAALSQLRSTISVFSEFEYAMAGVKAITRATAQDFRALKKEALDLSQSTKFTAQEVAEAEQALARGGFTASQTLGALKGTLSLAHVGQLDLAESARITSAVLHEFGLQASKASQVADVLAVGSTSAGNTVEELGNSLKYVGPIARAMGKDIYETAGVLEVLGRNGITSTLSGRALRGILAGLAAETPQTRKALKELGLTFDQINPSTKNFVEIFGKLHGAGMTAAQAVALFRREGFTAATVLAANVTQLKDFTDAQRKSADEAQRMSGIWNDTTKISLKNMMSSLDLLKVQFGEGLEGALRQSAGTFQSFFNNSQSGARAWGEEFGKILAVLAQALLFVADNVGVLRAAFEAWLLVKAIAWLDGLIASLARTSAAEQALTAAAVEATAAIAAQTLAAERKVTILDQYGNAASVVTVEEKGMAAASEEATAASNNFVGAGITPLTIALGIATAALLGLNEEIKSTARAYQDTIEKIVASSEHMASRIGDIHEEIRQLTDKSVRQAEAAKQMLAEGVLPNSPRGQEISHNIELEYRRKQAEAISDVTKRISEAQQAETKLRQELAKESADLAYAQKHRSDAEFGGGDAFVGQKLEGLQDRIDATKQKLAEARNEVVALTKGANTLNESIKHMPTGEPKVPKIPAPPPETAKVTRQMRLDQLTQDAKDASEGLEQVAAAYLASKQAGDSANETLQVENKLRQVNREFIGLDVTELDRWIKKQHEDEQLVKGAQTIATQKEQRDGLVALIAAWGQGEEAATAQARANQILSQQTQASASAFEDQKQGIKDTVVELADLQSKADALARSNDLKISAQQLSQMAAAALVSVVAIKQEAAAQEVANAIRQQTAGLVGKERQEIEAKVRVQQQEAALSNSRQRLQELKEETEAQAAVAAARQAGLVSEEAAAEITRQANIDRQVKVALMEVEIERAKALAAIPPPNPFNPASVGSYQKAVAEVNSEFDATALKTESLIRLQGSYNRELTDGERAAKSAFDALGSSLEEILVQAAETGSVKWKDIFTSLADSLLKIFIDMLAQMLRRWIATQAAMAATSYSSGSGGGGGGGSWLSALGSLGGGGGTAGGVTGNTWGTTFVTGPGGGASTSAAAGYAGAGAVIAAFVAAYFVVQSWIAHHKREFEQFRVVNTGTGSLSWNLGSATAGVDHLASVADEMVKIVSGVVKNLGGLITGWTGDLTVSRSGHGKHTEYWVQYADGMVARFGNDAQAAFDFATIQAIKQAKIGGLPKEVRDAIAKSTATKVEDLQKEIDAAFELVTARLGDTGSRVYDIFRKFAGSINDAITKGILELQGALVRPGNINAGGGGLGPGSGGLNEKAGGRLPIEATLEEVKALSDLIASRNREVDAIRNQLLGVNDAGAQRLADIASFNRGIAESQGIVQAQIEFVQQQLAALGDKSGEAADHLREVLKGYLDQLQKIPEAISGAQLDMSIFDVLYQYLQGSQKYEKQRVEYARMKVDLEFQAIKAQLIALGMWDKYAQMWQDAYNQAMKDAGKPAGGKGGGNQKQQDLKQLQDLFTEHDLSTASDYARQLADINKKWNDAIPLAHGNAALLAQIAKDRQAEIDALKQQAALKVQTDISKWETNPRGTGNPWNNQLADVNKQAEDLKKEYLDTAKALGWSSDRIARGLARIDKATLEHAKAVDDAAIASLNLPVESTRKSVGDLKNTIDFLHDSVSRGTLSVARFNEVVGEVAQQAALDLLGRIADIYDQMGRFDQADELRRSQDEINFAIQVAQVNILYNALTALGDAGVALQQKLKPFLDIINDPKNWPDFSLPAPTRPSGSSDSGGNAEQDRASALESISNQVVTWLESGLKEQLKSALELKQAYDKTVESALKYGYSLQQINDAWNVQVASFVNNALDSWEHLGESDLAGQLRQINEQYLDLVNAFRELGASAADMARLESAHQNALNDFWKKATADAKKLLDSILHSNPSIPTLDQYTSLKARFEDALNRAQHGDLGAISEATDLGAQLEQISQSLFGTASGKFQSILNEIAAGMQSIISLGPPTEIPNQQLQEATNQTQLLAQILAVLRAQGIQNASSGGGVGGSGGGTPAGYVLAYGPGGVTAMVPSGIPLAAGWSYHPPSAPPIPSTAMAYASAMPSMPSGEWMGSALSTAVSPSDSLTSLTKEGAAEPKILFTGKSILAGVDDGSMSPSSKAAQAGLQAQVDDLKAQLRREQDRMDKVLDRFDAMTGHLGRLTTSLETALKRQPVAKAGDRQ